MSEGKPSTEEMMKGMDDAAKEAQAELLKGFKNWSCADTSHWWRRWYLKAGHKRLGRIMVGLAKTLEEAAK